MILFPEKLVFFFERLPKSKKPSQELDQSPIGGHFAPRDVAIHCVRPPKGNQEENPLGNRSGGKFGSAGERSTSKCVYVPRDPSYRLSKKSVSAKLRADENKNVLDCENSHRILLLNASRYFEGESELIRGIVHVFDNRPG